MTPIKTLNDLTCFLQQRGGLNTCICHAGILLLQLLLEIKNLLAKP